MPEYQSQALITNWHDVSGIAGALVFWLVDPIKCSVNMILQFLISGIEVAILAKHRPINGVVVGSEFPVTAFFARV